MLIRGNCLYMVASLSFALLFRIQEISIAMCGDTSENRYENIALQYTYYYNSYI